MRDREVILGGSAVLKFLACCTFKVGDFDLFTTIANARPVVRHLVEMEGYTLVRQVSYPYQPLSIVAYCATNASAYDAGVSYSARLRRGSVFVDVYGSGVNTPWGIGSSTIPLGYSWTTVLQNYIYHDGFCSAYPTLTLSSRALYVRHRVLDASFPDGTSMLPWNKYLDRHIGFRLYAGDWDVDSSGTIRFCKQSWVCRLLERSFGDSGCLWVSFSGEPLTGAGTSWVLGGTPCFNCDAEHIAAPYVYPPSPVMANVDTHFH